MRTIIQTFFSKFLGAAISFILVIATTQYLGSEGRGVISLLLLAISINILVAGFIGSGSIVFLTTLFPIKKIAPITTIWAILACLLSTVAQYYLTTFPSTYFGYVLTISIVSSLFVNNTSFLQAQHKIKWVNSLQILQIAFTAIGILITIIFFNHFTIDGYLLCICISYFSTYIISLGLLYNTTTNNHTDSAISIYKKLLYHGSLVFTANLAQLLNYRFSFYLIENYWGLSQLGIYSVAITIAESIWMISKSISTYQYPKIAHSTNEQANISMTITYSVISFWITLLVVVIGLLLPKSIYTVVFGAEFSPIKPVISLLAFGICALAVSNIIVHYFSAKGKHNISAFSSLIGLCVTIPLGFYLIPKYGIMGAGITASIAYTCSASYLIYEFGKIQRLKISDLKISYIAWKNLFVQ